VNPWITGVVLTVITGLVILGGIKSIGRVTSFLVPFYFD
jgi:alanine or glycine:cation symporter, AGCS family